MEYARLAYFVMTIYPTATHTRTRCYPYMSIAVQHYASHNFLAKKYFNPCPLTRGRRFSVYQKIPLNRMLQSTPPHKGATAILPNSPHPFFNKFDKFIRKIALTFHFPAHSRPYHTIFVQFFKCESPSTFMCASHSHRFSTILNFPILPLLIQKSKGSVTSNPGLAPMCSTLFLYLSPK